MNQTNTAIPGVSIALCTYNGAKYLGQQLDSILDQTYQNITEIICVDDKSSDDTIDVLKQYQQKDCRIKIFENTENIGYIKNFEKALSLCNEELIALSDQDDIWHPSKIECQVNAIGDNLIVYSDSEYINEENLKLGRKLSDYRHLGVCTSCLNFALFNGISGHTMLIRKDLVSMATPFPETMPHDHWMSFIAAKNKKITFTNNLFVQYRQHSQSIIGGFGSKKKIKNNPYTQLYARLTLFGASLDTDNIKEKAFIESLADTYINISIRKRIRKMLLFLSCKQDLLFFKKRTNFRKTIYCFKMLWSAI